MEGVQMIECDESRDKVPVIEAMIVSLGENGRNFVIGPGALKMVTVPKRYGVPCSEGEEGLEFYELSFYQGSVRRGKLVFSIGAHDKICLPYIEPLLSLREKEKKVA